MATILFWAIAFVSIWLVYRFAASRFRRTPAEPPPTELSRVPAKLKRGPQDRSGAVALVEPDDDGPL